MQRDTEHSHMAEAYKMGHKTSINPEKHVHVWTTYNHLCLRLKPTSFANSTAGVLKLEQFGVDQLLGFSKNSNKITCFRCILLSKQRVRGSTVTGTSCTTNAMNVVFRRVWIVKVDHEFDIINV